MDAGDLDEGVMRISWTKLHRNIGNGHGNDVDF